MAGYLKGNHPIGDTPILTSMNMGRCVNFREGKEKIFNKFACFCWFLGENKESRLYFEELVVVSKTSNDMDMTHILTIICLAVAFFLRSKLYGRDIWNWNLRRFKGLVIPGWVPRSAFQPRFFHLSTSRHDPGIAPVWFKALDMWGESIRLSFYSWGCNPLLQDEHFFVHE